METGSPKKSRLALSLPWVVIFTLVGFAGGVFVGLHPNWIPFSLPGDKTSTSADETAPLPKPRPESRPATQPLPHPTTTPAS